jgi:hypothetical protein
MGFPVVSADVAHNIDGTQQFSASDQNRRSDFGPSWEMNSCALDSVLLVMLILDMGHYRADQISESLLREIQIAGSQTVLSIIKKPWSLSTSKEITQLRDTLQHGLATFDETKYTIGGLHGVVTMFGALTTCVAQCHATWVAVSQCCSAGEWQYKTRTDGCIKISRFNGLYGPLEMVVDGYKGGKDRDWSRSAIKEHSACTSCRKAIAS